LCSSRRCRSLHCPFDSLRSLRRPVEITKFVKR
jgi:hypothetical protein